MRKPFFLFPLFLFPALVACSPGGVAEDSEAEQEEALVAAQQAAESVAEGTTEAPPAPECDDSQVQGLVGQSVDDAKAEQARTDAGADSVRVLTPDQMVTMEFDGKRLTINVDAQGTVTSLRCG